MTKIEHTVIIGGSSGIGLATARKLIGPGMKVTITGRNQDKLNSAWKSLGGAADKAPLRSSIADFYFTNPIARSSAVMAECSAIAHGRTRKAAAE